MKRFFLAVIFICPGFGGAEVTLSPVRARHATFLKELFEVPDVNRFFLGNKSASESAKDHMSAAKNDLYRNREIFYGNWVIKDQGKVAGYLAMSAVETDWLPPKVQSKFRKTTSDELYLVVGFALLPEFRGNGTASKALMAALKYAKDTLRSKYVFASANNLNEPSIRLLKRNGFLPFHSGLKSTKFFLQLN
jgi:RimJ/RimL family protein N-acetyltransferase